MRRLYMVALVLICLMSLFSGGSPIRAQGPAKSTPTASPSATPAVPSITVLVARFDTTGITPLPQNVSGANAAITALLGKLTAAKVKVQQAGTPIKTIDDARAAGQKANVPLVIWGAPSGGALVIHYDLLGREQALTTNLSLRENHTHAGLYTYVPETIFPLITDVKPDILASFTQAQVYIAIGDDTNAQAALRTASDSISLNPSSDSNVTAALTNEILFNLSYLEAIQGKVDTSIRDLQNVLNNSPRAEINLIGTNNIGALAIDKGDFSTAVKLLNQAIQSNSSFAIAYFNRGTGYRWLGNQKLSLADFQAGLKLDKTNSFGLNDRGWLYALTGQFDSAIADLSEAIKNDPKMIDALLNRALIYRSNGQFQDALDDVNQTVTLDPKFEPGFSVRASVYINLQEYDNALADFNTAIGLAPTDYFSYEGRGIVYARLAQYDKAVGDFTQAISFAPSYPYPYLERADVYNKLGQYENAILDATQALELDSQGTAAQGGVLAESYYIRAEAYTALGRYAEAIRDYTKYLQVSPQGFFAAAAKGRLNGIKILVTPTSSPTKTATRTPTGTSTSTKVPPTSTSTNTPTTIPSNTASKTPTVVPSNTAANTATNTAVPPTKVPPTKVPPTDTPTKVAPTNTAIPTDTAAATGAATSSL